MRYRRDFNGYSTFSATPDSLELASTLSDVGRHPEIAMAAYKPEVVITRERHEISARFQRIQDIFDNAQHARAISNIVQCRPTSGRQSEIAMAKCKPEVVITQERNEIEAKSQRLHQYFRPWPTYWNWSRHCPMSADIRKWRGQPQRRGDGRQCGYVGRAGCRAR